jgi:transcriptional antiterminator RfaH
VEHLNGHDASTWYLVRTRPLCEYKAAAGLERNGYDLFFPRVNTPKPRRGHEDTPLFPGYLFVRFDRAGTGLPPVNKVSGLVGWVEFDGVVPPVPDAVISEMSRTVDDVNRNGGYWRRFQQGEMVRITSGWMNNLAEILEEPESPNSRVRVLLNFMGRLVRARVPWKELEAVDGGPARYGSGRPPRRTRGKGRWIRGQGPRALEGG